jgi:outer membrane receptor for ferrienterochelin and colicins
MSTTSALRRALLLAALLLVAAALPAAAQQQITGTLTSSTGPVADARVWIEEGAEALSRADGRFLLVGVPTGEVTVNVSALSFGATARTVEVGAGETVRLDLALEVDAVAIDPIVVTGTMSAMRVSESPVKVDVVSQALLQRNATSNLTESLGHINGLYTQVDCAVCYTNNIRINGMEGPYTGVLIDGMPIMGALASVYGLNGIDPALIERIEILKGPQSTLYGTEAMGGVINVITKDPRFAPEWALDLQQSDVGRTTARLGAAPTIGGLRTLVSGSVVHNDRFVDDNGDAFSDLTLDTRVSLFAKTNLYREGREALSVAVKGYFEDRYGGPENWTEADRGSSSLYGESIRTNRIELLARGALPFENVRAEGSYTFHEQDSFYGDVGYFATQQIGLGQVVWDPARSGLNDWLFGATLRLDSYNDDTPATPSTDVRFIPGLFVENSIIPVKDVTLLGGLRLDHQERHGAILSPRLALKWRAADQTTFRVNYGTGFRIVNLFTEDHAALTGARQVVIANDLAPEQSRSFTFNANQILEFGSNPMMIDLDLFHTRFSNKIIPDFDANPNQIVYANLDGFAITRGVSLALNQNFGATPFAYTLGFTLQDVFLEDAGVQEDEFFAADYQGVWSASYTFGGKVTADYTGNLIGPMRLPEFEAPFERPTRNDPYTVHNLQATVADVGGFDLYLGVKNLFDFTQGSPLVDAANPFGESFDTSYVWGPILGRQVVFGMRIAGGR